MSGLSRRSSACCSLNCIEMLQNIFKCDCTVQAVKCLVFLAPQLEASVEPAAARAAAGGAGAEAGPAAQSHGVHQAEPAAEGSDDDEEEEEDRKSGEAANGDSVFTLAGLIRRMTRAAGNRQYAGAQRRLVALRFIAGQTLLL